MTDTFDIEEGIRYDIIIFLTQRTMNDRGTTTGFVAKMFNLDELDVILFFGELLETNHILKSEQNGLFYLVMRFDVAHGDDVDNQSFRGYGEA